MIRIYKAPGNIYGNYISVLKEFFDNLVSGDSSATDPVRLKLTINK